VSPALARPLLHTVHLLTFLLLLATGLLLLLPGLRAAVTGGYSLSIRSAHRWGGVAFIVLPALIVWRAGPRRIVVATDVTAFRRLWRGFHLGLTALLSLLLAASGAALWDKRVLPDGFADASAALHDWLTYAAVALLALHLGEVGVAAIVARVRAAAVTGSSTEP
jgi:hypothetical protein